MGVTTLEVRMILPGRDEEDFEARDALHTLLRAEDIKKDGELLSRIVGVIQCKKEALESVEESISGDILDMKPTATKSMDDFLSRLNRANLKEDYKTNESPEDRRRRIAKGKQSKISRDRVLIKFT